MVFFVLIGGIILISAWLMDNSILRLTAIKIFHNQTWIRVRDEIVDERMELYKTLSLIGLSIYYLFFDFAAITLFFVIAIGILSFLRCLRYPDKICCYDAPAKEFPILVVIFLFIAAGLAMPFISRIDMDCHFFIMIGIPTAIMFGIYVIVVCLIAGQRAWAIITLLVPMILFIAGSFISLNCLHGITLVEQKTTTVEQTHMGMHTNGFSIPKSDSVYGKFYFVSSDDKLEEGTPIQITAYKGCLGITWYTTSVLDSGPNLY